MPDIGDIAQSRTRRCMANLSRGLMLDTRERRTMWLLFFANLINYMDRFTISGVLPQIKADYGLDDKEAGLLQTSFIVAYLLTAPIFGYLSDRFNRKILIIIGMSIWLIAVIGGSFVPNNMPYLFFISRAVVGIGEASYGVIVPTMIADMFVGNTRSNMFMFFYIAIPVGSGLGYGIGSTVTALTNSWRWGMRATPVLGFLLLGFTAIAVKDPERGISDAMHVERTSLASDLKYIAKRKTFWLATAACTMNFFMIGSLSWWTPTVTRYAFAAQNGGEVPSGVEASLAITFGVITCVGGLIGVAVGTSMSNICRGLAQTENQFYKGADPFICGAACLFGAPMLFFALKVFILSINVGWIFTFLAVTALCVPWAVNTDIVMRTILPNRRGIANSIMTSISHLFGDSISPYLVGVVSDALMSFNKDDTALGHYTALQWALIAANITLIFAALLYFAASWTMIDDLNAFDAEHYGILTYNSLTNSQPSIAPSNNQAPARNNSSHNILAGVIVDNSDPIVRNSNPTPDSRPGSTEPTASAPQKAINTKSSASAKGVKEVNKSKPSHNASEESEEPITLDHKVLLDNDEEVQSLLKPGNSDHTQVESEHHQSQPTQNTSVEATQTLHD